MLDETQTEGRWISFVEIDPAPKTKRWRVVSRGTMRSYGVVSWAGAWRRYAFTAEQGAVLQADCLQDIADFCSHWTVEHVSMSASRRDPTGKLQPKRVKV